MTTGSLLALLPHRAAEATVAVLFVTGAVLLLRGRKDHGDGHLKVSGNRPEFWPVAGASFTVILPAESGDLTQILTAGLAVRYHNPAAAGTGPVLALWPVAGLAITAGRGLLKFIPVTLITRAAAMAILILAADGLAAAIG